MCVYPVVYNFFLNMAVEFLCLLSTYKYNSVMVRNDDKIFAIAIDIFILSISIVNMETNK